MNGIAILLAVTLIAPLEVAAQTPAPTPAPIQQDASAPADPEIERVALSGKVASLEEQLAETKSAVSALQKLKFSGYVQGRWAQREDARYNPPSTAAYSGPSNDDFFIRRGRLKAVYDTDWAVYAVQLDATPSGVGVKEAFAEVKLPWVQGLSIQGGLQLMPFGYEVGVRSSADLDLLERSRASRSFLAGEYDLGVALRGVYGPFNFRAGVFNGNGVDGGRGVDNDQLKDIIGRLGFDLGVVTGGVSGWYGETIHYASADDARYDRWRVGSDLQVYLDLLPVGGTAVKGEVIWGRTFISSSNGGAGSALGQLGLGWNAVVTQTLGKWNALSVRYDAWTPDVQADEEADAVFRQDEISAALHTYLGGNLKVSLAYFHPFNGDAGDDAEDPKADQYMAQLQAKF